jgi:transcriptional regulator with XRE-family HTH domain
MTRLGSEHLADMSNEGTRVRERRERLGVDKKELATAAGVNRNTLAAIEAGESFNRTSLAKIERALDSLELEAGVNAPPPDASSGTRLATFDVSGEGGFHIIVSGPVEDADILKRQVVDIIQAMRKAESDDPKPAAG